MRFYFKKTYFFIVFMCSSFLSFSNDDSDFKNFISFSLENGLLLGKIPDALNNNRPIFTLGFMLNYTTLVNLYQNDEVRMGFDVGLEAGWGFKMYFLDADRPTKPVEGLYDFDQQIMMVFRTNTGHLWSQFGVGAQMTGTIYDAKQNVGSLYSTDSIYRVSFMPVASIKVGYRFIWVGYDIIMGSTETMIYIPFYFGLRLEL